MMVLYQSRTKSEAKNTTTRADKPMCGWVSVTNVKIECLPHLKSSSGMCYSAYTCSVNDTRHFFHSRRIYVPLVRETLMQLDEERTQFLEIFSNVCKWELIGLFKEFRKNRAQHTNPLFRSFELSAK